jgi:hypothetical protein
VPGPAKTNSGPDQFNKEEGTVSNWVRKLSIAALLLIALLNGAHAIYAEANPLSFVDPAGLVSDHRQPRDMQLLEGGGGGPSLGGQIGGNGGGMGRSGGGLIQSPGAMGSARGGRLGSPSTPDHVDQVSCRLEERGWAITGSGGRRPEEYLPGPGGARKGSSYPDITAEKDGRTLRLNTIDTRADGVTPTSREAENAARIRRQTGDHLLLVPKP